MTAHYKTQAFIFKKNDLNESDRIFSVFTDNFGRLDIFAKAIRKSVSKLRSGIDIFFLSEIEFIHGRSKKILTDAKALGKFVNIMQDPARFKIANAIGEVLENFLKGQEKDEAIFTLINDTFVKLNNFQSKSFNLQLLYYYFLWNFLSLQGYKPEIEKCNICHTKLNPYSIYFSDKLGGTICKKCLSQDVSAKKINSDAVKLLRIIFKKDWEILSKLKINSASKELFKKISDGYYLYILPSCSLIR